MKFKKGQSLIELLVAIAVGTILIGGSVTLMGVSLKSYAGIRKHLQANVLIRQSAEVIQSLARNNWHSIYDLTPGIHYKIAKRGNVYTLQKGEEKILDDTNLVAYWNMDEGSGQTAYDNKNTNNGTLTNSPTWKSGSDCVSGNCLEFNGSTNYVNCGTALADSIESVGTIEMWVYPIALGGLFSRSTGAGWLDERMVLHFYGTDGKLDLTLSDGSGYVRHISNSVVETGRWTHIIVTWDGSTVKHYFDGIENRSQAQGKIPEITGVKTWIGRVEGLSPNYFNGSIDEVRIYNTALSVEEIGEHYKAGLDKLGLVGYWSMDENGDTTAYDNANSNNGTLYNSPTWKSGSDCVNGSCLEFNGSNNYVSVPTPITATDSYSIELWFRSNDNTEGKHIFEGTTLSEPSLEGTDADYKFYVNNNQYISTGAITAGKWYHFVGTWDESVGQIKGYLDGSLLSTKTDTTDSSFATLYLASRGGTSRYFNGLIDEVRIYNRALTEQEINNRYQAGYTRYITFNKISRTSGNIDTAYSSANDDPSTLKTISTVKCGEGLVSEQSGGILSVASYLTRFENNKILHQTDWSGGSGITGPVSNSSNQYDTSSNITDSTVGQITMATTTSDGILTSSILDTGVSGGAGFNSLLWQGSLGTGGAVKFQIAFSNSSSGPWTYYGPTSTSDWYQPLSDISISFPTTGSASPQNKRYIRYKVNLSTTGTTPTINDIIINWSP